MPNRSVYTPPNALVQKWAQSSPVQFTETHWYYEQHLANKAAAWGARQQTELDHDTECKSLKQQALDAFYGVVSGTNDARDQYHDLDIILKALNSLPG